MTQRSPSAFIAASLACIALLATDAHAQFGGGMGGGMGGGSGMRRGGGERASRSAEAAPSPAVHATLAERLDQMAAQLLLTPEQAGSWSAFRAAFMALQRPPGGVALSDAGSAQGTMQRKLSQAQDFFTQVEALADALKQLDRDLDARQRATEDRLLPPLLAEFVRSDSGRERLAGGPRS